MLPNGSILVIGGETGSNASPQPNLEVLPKPAGGDTVIDLDFLSRTDPYNLYPFVIVLPSKNLFVGKFENFIVVNRTPSMFSFFKAITTKLGFSNLRHLLPLPNCLIFRVRSMIVRISTSFRFFEFAV